MWGCFGGIRKRITTKNAKAPRKLKYLGELGGGFFISSYDKKDKPQRTQTKTQRTQCLNGTRCAFVVNAVVKTACGAEGGVLSEKI